MAVNNKTFYFSVVVSFLVGAAVSSFTLANVSDKPTPNTGLVEQALANLISQQETTEQVFVDLVLRQEEIESKLSHTNHGMDDLIKTVRAELQRGLNCECETGEYNPYPDYPPYPNEADD